MVLDSYNLTAHKKTRTNLQSFENQLHGIVITVPYSLKGAEFKTSDVKLDYF